MIKKLLLFLKKLLLFLMPCLLIACGTKPPVITLCDVAPQLCDPGTGKPIPTPTPTPTAVPQPTPTPVPTPTPTPPPPVPPNGATIAGGTWQLVDPTSPFPSPKRLPPLYNHTIDSALVELTGCAPGSDCVFSDPIQVAISKVAAILRAEGYAAGQFEPGITDEIAISGTGQEEGAVTEAQGYHIYNTGGNKVVWSNGADWQSGKGAYRDTWVKVVNLPPASPGPVPQRIVSRMQVKRVGPARPVFDATPQTGPDHAFCLSIGKDQDYCPLGGECAESTPADQCAKIGANRTAAEEAAGPYTWQHWRSGVLLGDGGPANDQVPNPLQWVFPGALKGDTIVVCAANKVCSTPLGVQ